MGHQLPWPCSVVVAEFEWTKTWRRFNLWGHGTINGESLPCIQKWKHYMDNEEYVSAFDM